MRYSSLWNRRCALPPCAAGAACSVITRHKMKDILRQQPVCDLVCCLQIIRLLHDAARNIGIARDMCLRIRESCRSKALLQSVGVAVSSLAAVYDQNLFYDMPPLLFFSLGYQCHLRARRFDILILITFMIIAEIWCIVNSYFQVFSCFFAGL